MMSGGTPGQNERAVELNPRPVGPDDLVQMSAALRAASLPADDLDDPNLRLFAYELDGLVIGYGGLEPHGEDALLRSVVVGAQGRGTGLGRKIVGALIAEAKRLGARRLYLLTTDQRDFFARLGFVATDRQSAPAGIASSRQMRQLCPATAILMRRDLPDM